MNNSTVRPIKVGIAGAAGSVGSALVRRLHDAGWQVIAATRNRLGAALLNAAVPGCEIRIGSLTPGGATHPLDDCDVIINCALAGSGGNPRQAYVRNRALVDGLMKAKSIRWLIHFSTVASYGELNRQQSDEQRAFQQPRPDSEYGRSKLDTERYAVRQTGLRGIKFTALRLGHVYGLGCPRSKEIIEFALDPHFRLPYDGRLASNAIRIDRLAASIVQLLSSDPPGSIYNFAEYDRTWRQVFDWHTACLGRSAVLAMSDEESDAAHNVYEKASFVLDTLAWLRSLPINDLIRSPAVFDLALQILVKTPPWITEYVTGINRRLGARRIVAQAGSDQRPTLHPAYYSAGMPGPFLELATIPTEGLGSEIEYCQALRQWYHQLSTPKLPELSQWSGETRP